jgi:pyrimidine deaminase RibD-like protein
MSQACRDAILLFLDDRHSVDPSRTVDDAEIAAALSIPLDEVQRQLDILESQCLINAANSFENQSAWISPRGLLAVEEIRTRQVPAAALAPTEHALMELSVELARRCSSETPGRESPKVGAILVRDGHVLATAYRGELGHGEHAEYTLLERKLKDVSVAGATLYTTLEPCTTRNHPKVPCAVRIAERKIARVVIGMLDPNPSICGRGVRRLRDAGVAVDLFAKDPADQIEELNRAFIRSFPVGASSLQSASPAPIEIDFGSDPDLTFVGLLPAFDSPGAATPAGCILDSYFSHLRIANNDPQAASLDRIWIESDGLEPTRTLAYNLEGDRRLAPRSARVYRLRYTAAFDGQMPARDRLSLCIKVFGLGAFRAPLPAWVFLSQDKRPAG